MQLFSGNGIKHGLFTEARTLINSDHFKPTSREAALQAVDKAEKKAQEKKEIQKA